MVELDKWMQRIVRCLPNGDSAVLDGW
jgi:hypothetical protein